MIDLEKLTPQVVSKLSDVEQKARLEHPEVLGKLIRGTFFKLQLSKN